MRNLWRLTLAHLILLSACPGNDADVGWVPPDSGVPDSGWDGGAADADPPDLGDDDPDDDGVLSALDNCPQHPNRDQNDRDEDGVGDVCDSCPWTPNGPNGGSLSQEACLGYLDNEPNNHWSRAQTISLPAVGSTVEFVGTIETSTSGQAYDWLRFQAAPGTMLRATIERLSGSTLEPLIGVEGGHYRFRREAEGAERAERDFYFVAEENFELMITDRRGYRGGPPVGGDTYRYRLLLRSVDVVPVQLPAIAPGASHETSLIPERPGQVFVLQPADEGLYGLLSQTTYGQGGANGTDVILRAVEGGEALFPLEENNLSATIKDARMIHRIGESGRIVVDHQNIHGADETVVLRVWKLHEQAPEDINNDVWNNALDLDRTVYYSSYYEQSNDQDWYRFYGVRGHVTALFGGGPSSPLVVQRTEIGRIENGNFIKLGETPSGGQIMIEESGEYYARYSDSGSGVRDPVPQFQYAVAKSSTRLANADEQRVLTYGRMLGQYLSASDVNLYEIRAAASMQFRVSLVDVNPGLTPTMVLFGPDGEFVMERSTTEIATELPESRRSYYLTIFSSTDPSGPFDPNPYALDVELTRKR